MQDLVVQLSWDIAVAMSGVICNERYLKQGDVTIHVVYVDMIERHMFLSDI